VKAQIRTKTSREKARCAWDVMNIDIDGECIISFAIGCDPANAPVSPRLKRPYFVQQASNIHSVHRRVEQIKKKEDAKKGKPQLAHSCFPKSLLDAPRWIA
jgi:hypothetical protein